MIPADLAAAVAALATRPTLLVALDFDGVLAPIVERPDAARPLPGSMAEVRHLARLEGVEVALVSGRALASLRAVSGISDEDALSLVGSHGAEHDLRALLAGPSSAPAPLSARESTLLAHLGEELQGIADTDPEGRLDVETKPTAAVLHTRRAPADLARQATDAAMAGPATWAGVHVTLGKAVVELSVVETSKGTALQQLRASGRVDAVLYVGDDVTDETAFAVLGAPDVGVKVGPGETHAAYRLNGPADVRDLLQLLVAERSQR